MSLADQVAARRREVARRNNKHREKLVTEVNAKTRRLVWCMAAAGLDELEISKALNISPRLLAKAFHSELHYGGGVASARVVATLYEVATDKSHPQCVTAAKFWLSARANWSEKTETKTVTRIEGLKFQDDDALIAIARRSLEGMGPEDGKGRPN